MNDLEKLIKFNKPAASKKMKAIQKKIAAERQKKIGRSSLLAAGFTKEDLNLFAQDYFEKNTFFLKPNEERKTWAESLYGKKVFIETLHKYQFTDVDIFQDGKYIDLSEFRAHSKKVGPFKDRFLRFLKKESTGFRVRTLEKYHPEIQKIAHDLEGIFDSKVTVNAYISLSKGKILPSHWDTHDVMLIQTYGQKKWLVERSKVELPLPSYRDLESDLKKKNSISARAQLQPGGILYMPRGHWHSGEGQHSIHLTFGFSEETVASKMQKIISETLASTFSHIDYRQIFEPLVTFEKKNNDKVLGDLVEKLKRSIDTNLAKKMRLK